MAKIISTSTQDFKEAAKYAKESSKISAFLDNHFFTIGEAIVAGLSGVTAFQFAPMAVKAIGEQGLNYKKLVLGGGAAAVTGITAFLAYSIGKEIYKQINDSDLIKNFLTEMKRPKIGGAALETIESAASYLIKDKDRLEHLIKSFKGKEAYEQKDAVDIQKIIDKLIDVQKIIPPAGIFMDENSKAIGELRSFQKKNESLTQDSGLSL